MNSSLGNLSRRGNANNTEPKRESSVNSSVRNDRQSQRGLDAKSAPRSVQEMRSNGSAGGDNPEGDASSNEKTNSSSNNAGEDDWRIRAWEVFTTIADRGYVSPEGMTAFANEMNVECELRHVMRAVRQEAFEGNIGFDQATRLLEVIPAMLYDEGSESDQNEDRHVLKLLPWEYLMFKLRPEEERRKIEDEKIVKLVYCGCTPQQWMLLATGLIFLSVVGAILGLMIGLWITSDNRMFAHTLETSTRIASRYIDIATDISREGLKDAMHDLVLFTTHALETDTNAQIGIMRQNGQNRLIIDYPVVQATMNATIEGRVAELKGRVDAIADILHNSSVVGKAMRSSLVATLNNWEVTSGYEYFLVEASSFTTIVGASASHAVFSQAHCCAPLANGESGFINSGRGVRGALDARIAYVSTPAFRLCISLSADKLLRMSREAITTLINQANSATFASSDTPRLPKMETVYAYRDSNFNNGVMSIRTKLMYSNMYCELHKPGSGQGTSEMAAAHSACVSFDNLLEKCRATKCSFQNYATYYYNGELFIVSVTYEPMSDAVLASGQSVDWAIQIARSSYIDGVTAINKARILPLDISFATITRNGELIPQMNIPLYECPTGVKCRWLPSAVSTIRSAFNTGSPRITVCPNYVFDPVVSGANTLFFNDTVVVQDRLERSQLKLAESIGKAFDNANARLPEGMELQLYRSADSTFLRTFGNASCPRGALCESDPAFGIVEVSTCVGCKRAYAGHHNDDVHFITNLLCKDPRACNKDKPAVDMSLFKGADYTTDEIFIDNGKDYHGKSVLYSTGYLPAVDAGISIFADKGVLNAFRTKVFTIFSVVIILSVLASIVLLMLLTRHTLAKVENEWFVYKASIEGEKQKFNTMFQEIVPPKVLVKYHRGQKIVAESHNMLSIAFVDVCAFAERQKSLSAKEVVRTIAYHFEVYATVAAKFKLFRLKTFGDSTAVVGGIGTKEPASAVAFAVASFAGYVAQLMSPIFSHYPQLLTKLAEAYKNDPNPERPRQVFQIRIGLHAGAATSSMVDYGRTPSFDLLGPSMSLARRMQVTAAAGRINCSTSFKEQLEMGDFAGQFEFDTIKKLVAKGQGTVSTYPIRSMSLTIDEMLLQRLHIKYADGMFDFRPLSAQCKGVKSQGSSSAPSNKTGDSASIHDSMMASTNPPGPDDRHY